VEEIDRQDAGGLVAQERPPAGVLLAGCRADTVSGQDATYRAGPDPVTKPLQFALDSAVAPPRIVAGQAQYQVSDLVADRWPARRVRVGPAPAEQAAVPGQQRRRGQDPVRSYLAGQQLGQGGQDRPVRPEQPRPTSDLATQHRHLMPQHEDLDQQRFVAPD
jgi:hypothetical protein